MHARTQAARAAAQRALVRLVLELGVRAHELVVVGGLNPDFLAADGTLPHQGTTDIDMFVALGAVWERDDDDFSWLEAALYRADFRPGGAGWRWVTEVDGIPVRLDLLTDVHDNVGQQIALPGTKVLASQNLSGPGAARRDVLVRQLAVDPRDRPDPGTTMVEVRCIGLGGYVLAKAAAMLGRAEAKDAYDLAFVLLNNAEGGPRPAGRAAAHALDGPTKSAQVATLRAALGRFANAGPAARDYALQRELDGDASGVDVLVQDAIAGARQCLAAFDAAVEDLDRAWGDDRA